MYSGAGRGGLVGFLEKGGYGVSLWSVGGSQNEEFREEKTFLEESFIYFGIRIGL